MFLGGWVGGRRGWWVDVCVRGGGWGEGAEGSRRQERCAGHREGVV